ncbi:hypothetical protein Tco_1102249, partial [Tanacetum coccineum]
KQDLSLAKAEASQKRKSSTSGAISSHVTKHTRSALAQSSGSITRPSLFAGDDDESDDDDACVEIPLVTVLRSAAALGMRVLHCMMMSHGGELLARYHELNQSHHEYVLSIDSRLKGYKEKSKAKGKERKNKIKSLTKRDEEILRPKATPPKFSSFFQGQFQGLVQKFLASDEFSRVQGELLSLAASAGFEHGLRMHQTKDEFADISKYAAEPLLVILQLKPEKLVHPANVPILRDTRVSPPIAKESIVTPVSKSLELSANVVPASSAIALE